MFASHNPLRHILLPLVMSLAFAGVPSALAGKGPCDWAFVNLEYARNEKVEQLRRFCDYIHERVTCLRHDEALIEFFYVNLKYTDTVHNDSLPDKVHRRIEELRQDAIDYYANTYLCFYDLLFVDTSGFVFYTIRKESDYHANLLQDDPSFKHLTDVLRRCPQEETFIDFHCYAPSQESAAFFVEPVRRKGEHIGWVIAQCAVNKVNSLFAGAQTLGATGETLLIDRGGYLLTESNFEGESTILKKRLDNKNIDAKFREKQGNKVVTDYRGCTALTSFEVLDFLGTQWLVVAKVDEAQIISEHFKQHRRYYMEVITKHIASCPATGDEIPGGKIDKDHIRVDMDEFRRAGHGETLLTLGVSTCTAVIASYPGKFAYMAHVSPYDKAYGRDGTDLLGHIATKVKMYDIYKHERHAIRFIIVANHFDSLGRIVDKLVDEGFHLSQINVLYHPNAKSASIVKYDYSDDHTSVEWALAETDGVKIKQTDSDAYNLGAIVKKHLDD